LCHVEPLLQDRWGIMQEFKCFLHHLEGFCLTSRAFCVTSNVQFGT
jgi:hypothetical protein